MQKWMLNMVFFALLLLASSIIVQAQNTLPVPKSSGEPIVHQYFSLGYSEPHEQALWVTYRLQREQLKKKVERNDMFHDDWYIKSQSATYQDYSNSGYDAGHLCPARQMQFDCVAMHESFFMSNISPMLPEFNRRAWAFLEKLERNYIWQRGKLLIYVGPVFDSSHASIGENKVRIPQAFYRILVDETKKEAIAFLLPHRRVLEPLETFIVPIDSIETLTNIDFLYHYSEKDQQRMESTSKVGNWTFENPNLSYGYTLRPYPCSQTDIIKGQEKISINLATAAALEQLPGIGPSKAKAIIAGRPYKSTTDLLHIKGIGQATYTGLKDFVRL